MAFIELCDQLRIILAILPPHSTHRLQPLNISLFRPLTTYYTNGLNDLLFSSLSLISMSKRASFKVSWPAWQQAFSDKNTISGFGKTGIWPCNSAIVLSQITIPQAEPIMDHDFKTPTTCRAARRVRRLYIRQPTSPLINKILRAHLYLAAQHSIDVHIQNGFVDALKQEKKRRRRGKRLDLVGEDGGGPQLFSPSRVQAARDYQASKEAEEAERQQGIKDKKAAAAAKKEQKKKEKNEKADDVAARRQIHADTKARKAAEKQQLQEAKQAAAERKRQELVAENASKIPKRAGKQRKPQRQIVSEVAAAPRVEEVISGTSRTRTIYRPSRYND